MAGRKHRLRAAVRRAAWAVVLLGGAGSAQGGAPPIVIGTGPVAGTYFPAGGAICNAFNRGRDAQGPRCLVQSTAGSRDNLTRLARGEIDFALVQSDWQYLALNGGAGEDTGDIRDLRAVFSLQAHTITVVVRPEAGIATLADLRGRRVNLGPPGSAMRFAAEAFMDAMGWSRDDLGEIAELGLGELHGALCAGRIDAFVLPVSHPDGTVSAAAAMCAARLLSVPDEVIARLGAAWPFYAPSRIPPGLYSGQDGAVRSYGVRATLVTLAGVPEDTVFALTEAVFADLEGFTHQHPVLSGLTRQEMSTAGIVAEMHDGASRYFRSAAKE